MMRLALVVLLVGCGRMGFNETSADSGPIDSVAGATYAQTVLADGPVGYWRLDDPTTSIADVTGHGHDGLAMTGTTLGQPGLLAESDDAVAFDGVAGFVTVASSPALNFDTALTLEAWVSPARFDNTGGGGFPRIVQKGAGGVTGYGMQFEPVDGAHASIRMELEGVTPTNTFTGIAVVLAGTTHHVVSTYDGADVRLYVDGQLDDAFPCTGVVTSTTSNLDIGRRPDATRYFEGTIDEVAVYDKALSAAQIAAHYAAGR